MFKGKVNYMFFDKATRIGIKKAVEEITKEMPEIFADLIGKILRSKQDYLIKLEKIEQAEEEYRKLLDRKLIVWENLYYQRMTKTYARSGYNKSTSFGVKLYG